MDDSPRAVLALVEYFERRAHGWARLRSARFLQRTAQRLEGATGSGGVSLRTTLKALSRFGAPPVAFCLAGEGAEIDTSDPCLHGFRPDFSGLYVRLDDPRNGRSTLETVRQWLFAGCPCAFGFSVPTSLTRRADVPFRPLYDGVQGGAAAVAVGYDDDHLSSTKGALRIRSPWGVDWGHRGYGWLPYACVEAGLARDFWTIVKRSWR